MASNYIVGAKPNILRQVGTSLPLVGRCITTENRATNLNNAKPSSTMRNAALLATAASAGVVGLAVVMTLGYVSIPGMSSQIVMYVGIAGAGGTFVFGLLTTYQQGRISSFAKRAQADNAHLTYVIPNNGEQDIM